jgi:TonB-linked SusC/RagA family outer membrane protein
MIQKRKKWMLCLWKYPFVMGLFLVVTGMAGVQAQTVSGSVYDTQSEPLIGVTVSVKGATAGTMTDIDGNFTLSAKTGATILFRYLGYKDKEVKVAGAAMGKIVMEDSASDLDEVVVVGYGTQRKRDITGAITSVDSKLIEARNPVNVSEALQGVVAGALITATSGEPGTEANIVIRGLSTFEGGTGPLYVVDGVIMENIQALNPSDIMRMEVLKDGASTSMYGARAANGVILISTKSGADGKPKINIRYLNSYSTLANKLPQMNREEREIFDNTVVSASGKNQFQWFKSSNDTVNLQARTSNDYQEIISRMAVRNDATISMQTGTDKLNVYASLGLLDEKGIILTSYNQRYTGRVKAIYTVSPNVKFTTNITGGYQMGNFINEGSTFYTAIRRPTQSILYFPDGTLVNRYESNPSGKRNPLGELYDYKNETTTYSGLFNQGVEINFAKYFTLNGQVSANLRYADNITYSGPNIQAASADDLNKGVDKGTEKVTFRTDYLAESYLRFNRSFNEQHNVEVMAGLSTQTISTMTPYTIMANYLIKSDEMAVPHATESASSEEKKGETKIMASQFGRVSYDWMGRYLFRASIRRDGSSSFGPENRWGVFPSVSGAWRLSDEVFMDWSKPVLNDAKFRISWGQAGNDQIGYYDWRTMLDVSATTYSYGGVPGVYPQSMLGNKELKWETTTQTNYGLDLTFLDGRVSFSADYYIKATDDLLNREQLPSELGYTERRINVGSIENRGIELSVTAYPVDNKDWAWSTTINWTRNKNKVTSLYGDAYVYKDNYWVEAGKSAGNFYGYNYQGVYRYDVSNAWTEDYKTRLIPVFERDAYNNVIINKSGQPTLVGYQYPDGRDYGWTPDGTGNPVYAITYGSDASKAAYKGGDVIWEDVNHDGVIDGSDKKILGNAQNDWYAGWSNTVRYKDFTLNFNIYASWGGLIYNALLYDLSKYGDNTSNADPRGVVQGWRYQGQITDWYAPGNNARPSSNNRSLSSFYLEDASFIRLQTLRLAYQLPSKLAETVKLQSLQAYVYGNNLATWTNYRGYDPEITTGGVLNPNTDNQKYPKKREFGFGLNLTF